MHDKALAWTARLCLFAAVVIAGLTVVIAWQCQWSGPFRDYWEVMPLIEATFTRPISEWPWHELWAPYGGAHRMVIPKLLFILDFHLTGGSNYLILSASLLCLFTTFILIVMRVRHCYPTDPVMLWLSSAIALITLFSATQLFNLNYSYDTQWFGSIVFSVAALYLATHPAFNTRPAFYSTTALAAAALASINNMAGFLVWPSVIGILWFALTRPLWRAALLGVFGTVLLLYAHDIGLHAPSPVDSNNPILWWAIFLLHAIKYIGLYLGSPITRTWPVLAGLIAFIATLMILLRAWPKRYNTNTHSSLYLMLAGMALQTLLVAAATAWGRIYYPVSMAMAERFQMIALLFWLCASLALLMWLQKRQWHWRAIISIVLLTTALAPHQTVSTQKHIALSEAVHRAHLAATLDMTGMAVARNSIAFPAIQHQRNYMARHNTFLKRHRLGYFNEPLATAMQTPIIESPHRHDCTVQITHHMPADDNSSTELQGIVHCDTLSIDAIFLVDSTQRVRGFLIPPEFNITGDRQWAGHASHPIQELTPIIVRNNKPDTAITFY